MRDKKHPSVMKKYIVLYLFLFFSGSIFSQEPIKKGTIKVQKKGHLVKVVFDDVNYRLLGIDMYGNVIDTAVVEFKMYTTVKGIGYNASTIGPNLSREMQEIIDRRDSKTTLFFKDIKAKDRNGSIITMPNFTFTFPYVREENY